MRVVDFNQELRETKITRRIEKNPFIPTNACMDERAETMLNIQSYGLMKRISHTNSKCAVIGISGGLDSTLALLVTAATFDLLGLDRKGIDPKDRFVLRSKLTVEYNIKGIPLNPFASVDYGCGLNYTANKWKYSVGADYTINKQHKFTLYYRFQTEDDDDEPNGHMLGMGYKIKF